MVLSSEIEAKHVNTSSRGLDYSQLHCLHDQALGKLLSHIKHNKHIMK